MSELLDANRISERASTINIFRCNDRLGVHTDEYISLDDVFA